MSFYSLVKWSKAGQRLCRKSRSGSGVVSWGSTDSMDSVGNWVLGSGFYGFWSFWICTAKVGVLSAGPLLILNHWRATIGSPVQVQGRDGKLPAR